MIKKKNIELTYVIKEFPAYARLHQDWHFTNNIFYMQIMTQIELASSRSTCKIILHFVNHDKGLHGEQGYI
jgi:hypothetical protein